MPLACAAKISRKRNACATLRKLAFRRRGRFRHVKPEIGKQIGARNQPKKFVVIHDDGDSAAVKHAQQVVKFRVRRQRFQLIGHRLFHGIIKMRRFAVHFHQEIGFVDYANERVRFYRPPAAATRLSRAFA